MAALRPYSHRLTSDRAPASCATSRSKLEPRAFGRLGGGPPVAAAAAEAAAAGYRTRIDRELVAVLVSPTGRACRSQASASSRSGDDA